MGREERCAVSDVVSLDGPRCVGRRWRNPRFMNSADCCLLAVYYENDSPHR
jgi:hypothetical protein